MTNGPNGDGFEFEKIHEAIVGKLTPVRDSRGTLHAVIVNNSGLSILAIEAHFQGSFETHRPKRAKQVEPFSRTTIDDSQANEGVVIEASEIPVVLRGLNRVIDPLALQNRISPRHGNFFDPSMQQLADFAEPFQTALAEVADVPIPGCDNNRLA